MFHQLAKEGRLLDRSSWKHFYKKYDKIKRNHEKRRETGNSPQKGYAKANETKSTGTAFRSYS